MEADDDASSATSTESSDLEELAEDMDTFKEQIHAMYVATERIGQQLLGVTARAVEEEEAAAAAARPPVPVPAVKAWLATKDAPTMLTIKEYMEYFLDVAESLDLETRMVTFREEDAAILTGGRCSLEVYELLPILINCFQ